MLNLARTLECHLWLRSQTEVHQLDQLSLSH